MELLDVTVRVAGIDYTGQALASCRISRGRQDIYSVAQPGYASLTFIDIEGQGFPFQVTETLEVDIEEIDVFTLLPGPIPLFRGRISDITTSTFATSSGPKSTWSVVATSALADLNRRQILADGAPSELDGERAERIFADGLFVRWNEFPFVTWADIDADLEWQNVDVEIYIPIDGGDFMLAELPPREGGYNAYTLLAETVVSSGGSISEEGDGTILYLSGYTRSAFVVNVGWGPQELHEILTLNLKDRTVSSLQQASDIANVIEVEFDGGIIVRQDDVSISKFGRRTNTVRTLLADQSAAEARAEDILINLTTPYFKMPTLEWELRRDPEELSALTQLFPSFPVQLDGLPATLGNVAARNFVEGIEFDFNETSRIVRLYISDARLSLGSSRWSDVDVTLKWEDVSATLEWAEARRVTV